MVVHTTKGVQSYGKEYTQGILEQEGVEEGQQGIDRI
jgi:hypothetical protein